MFLDSRHASIHIAVRRLSHPPLAEAHALRAIKRTGNTKRSYQFPVKVTADSTNC